MESFQKYLELVLPKTEFNQLSAYLIEKKIKKGEIILNAGSICNHSFFVEEGLLRSYSIDEQGKEHIIQFAPENWMISDRSSLLFQEPSEFYIDAVENTILIMFEEEFVNKASEVSAKFRTFNQKALNNHIRHQQKRINQLLSATAEERYLNFIELYPNVTLRVPQWMIASYLGITPESLSRVRKELARKNFIPG
ncbi:MAG: Crp/Fnr family transcriptional regulator [Crocinitomicaceae bacterium]|jgi:CRP/FNR family transcriptional regulator, anaerobic regulatory protein|nr:Crp/Fnr family transcriptional regulator [Crocinitomicaceae bacterium]